MQWSLHYPTIVYLVLAGALLLLTLVARSTSISPQLQKWSLFVPRILLFGLLLLILLNPVDLHENQLPPRRSNVTYLVDGSRSMALDEPVSRLEQVRKVIFDASQALPEEDLPRIDLYRFGESLSAVPSVPQLQPIDDASAAEDALRQLPSRFQQELPKSVVVFSDGQFDETSQLVDLAETYQRLGIPVSVYQVGAEDVQGDIAISELVAPRIVQPGTKVPIRATVRGFGFEGRRVVLQIRQESDETGPPLASLPITVSATPKPYELVIESEQDNSRYLVEATPLPGESITANNRVPFQLNTGSRKLKVLYMEGTAGREYRFIHDALTEDPDIECVSMVVDTQYAARPRLQRVDDPYRGYPVTREELFEFDVVICSDISQGAFTREQIDWTVELVGERGGGFVMIGGHSSFGAGRWDQTAWDKLIPMDMAGGRWGSGYLTQRFQIQIPEEAQTHPIWQLLDDPIKNREALRKMPGFYGTNLIQRLKPAATLLGQSATPLQRVGQMPVFACETYGRGRTFALASDSTSFWGQDFERYWGEGDNRYFRKFWRNTVWWLSENSISGSKRLSVETDKIIYRPGEQIQLSATAYDSEYRKTTDYRLEATLSFEDSELTFPAIALNAQEGADQYRGELATKSPELEIDATKEFSTLYPAQLEVVATNGANEIARVMVPIQVLVDSPELQRPQPAPENLTVIAERSGGKVLRDSDQLAAHLEQFPASPGEVLVNRTPLWDTSWLWGVLLGLLGIEWTLRRKSGFG